MLKRLREILPLWHRKIHPASVDKPVLAEPAIEPAAVEPLDDEYIAAHPAANDVESLVNQMLAHHRYALLLRSQIAQNLTPELYATAEHALNEAMGLVPTGNVYLQPSVFDVDCQLIEFENLTAPEEFTVAVQSVYLDRHLVTNRQFQKFVDAGGYQEMAIWDQEIWPAVLDFIDQTDHPGPRFWKNGHYLPGQANLPVVGVSWYEAAAYARWVGKRLPTDAEWVKAGSWPVTLSPTTHLQRKYPWGDTFDRGKANVWASAPSRVVAVNEFSEGASVGGLYQLIGNVWEWTATTLEIDPDAEDAAQGHSTLLKSIRGGAFDTYFEHQANCHFASGENPILRKHNIGFRCALSICDIAEPPDAALHDSNLSDDVPNVKSPFENVHSEPIAGNDSTEEQLNSELSDDQVLVQPVESQATKENRA